MNRDPDPKAPARSLADRLRERQEWQLFGILGKADRRLATGWWTVLVLRGLLPTGDHVFVLDHMYMSLFSTGGWFLRLGVTIALLASVHPLLALLALFALPALVIAGWRPGVEIAADERGAPHRRLARHLFDVATTATPAKEVRLTAIGPP